MKKQEFKKNEERFWNLWDNFKCSNIQTRGVPEGEDQEMENLLENSKGELPQCGKGNRLSGSPGSPESQRSWTQGGTHQGKKKKSGKEKVEEFKSISVI